MKTYSIKVVDAFTTRPFGGNPAGVVTEAVGITPGEMQQIANEMNLVETTFVLPPTVPEADFLIRYFTPQNEVAIAGHPTIATIQALIDEGKIRLPNRSHQVRVETGAGVLPVEITVFPEVRNEITLTMATPRFEDAGLSHEEMASLLGTGSENLDCRYAIQKMYTGIYWLVVRLNSLAAIQNLRPDWNAIAELSRVKGVVGIQVFTTETVDPECHFHIRTFLPNEGINEDPVCGTGNSLVQNGIVNTNGHIRLVSEQGLEVGRPGRVFIDVEGKTHAVTKVRISGTAVTVLNGEIKF